MVKARDASVSGTLSPGKCSGGGPVTAPPERLSASAVRCGVDGAGIPVGERPEQRQARTATHPPVPGVPRPCRSTFIRL